VINEKTPNLIPPGLYAFPLYAAVPDGKGAVHYTTCAGMTLRDWFAGKALAGLMADPSVTGTMQQMAECCYRYADAMLAAREVGQ
jgi:hypothetical protein